MSNKLTTQNLAIREQLLKKITLSIKTSSLTQKQLANILKISQPRISNLINGKILLFSIDTLISLLERLDVKIEFQYCSWTQKETLPQLE